MNGSLNLDKGLLELKDYASINKIPIMLDDGIEFLTDFIKIHQVKKILEIGSAIGYSAIKMALVNPDIQVVTIEKDEKRYLEAVKNIKKFQLENQITILFKDALELDLKEKYDLIFIDAAKSQNKRLFEHFKDNLDFDGYIVTDNLNFHGYVKQPLEEIPSKNLRQLVRKIQDYINFLKENTLYRTRFYDIGDGISVTWKKGE